MNEPLSVAPPQTAEMLKLLAAKGGMCCTGSCHGLKPGQLHCRHIGNELNMGVVAVWRALNYLLSRGYVIRQIDEGCTHFIVTPKGKSLLLTLKNKV